MVENKNAIMSRLDNLEKLIVATTDKKAMTLDEVAIYTGLSKSYLYKLTSTGEIPHYKPRSKMLYFDRNEIDEWLLQNRQKLKSEIEQEAASFVHLKKMKP